MADQPGLAPRPPSEAPPAAPPPTSPPPRTPLTETPVATAAPPAPGPHRPSTPAEPRAAAGLRERLVSLDVFRGLTIAGMIIVNNPGSWAVPYSPLRHAEWNGLTPTDLVFPFFLFIVGVAMPFSFDRRLAEGASRLRLFEHVVRRTLILILLGLILAAAPSWPLLTAWTPESQARWRLLGAYIAAIIGLGALFIDEPPLAWPTATGARLRKVVSGLLLAGAIVLFILSWETFRTGNGGQPFRVPGVLQRIGLCYLFASLVVMWLGTRGRIVTIGVLLVGYWIVVTSGHAPADYAPAWAAARPTGVLHDWIDVRLLGDHLYRERPDPEGLLSTLPAIATVLLGVLAGTWLRTPREPRDRAGWLFLAANVLLVLGLWWALVFPLNKKIWTSSYVLVTGGLAMHFLAACYWLVDVYGRRRWAAPFLVIGTNAIAVYFVAGIGKRWLDSAAVASRPDGSPVSAWTWFYEAIRDQLGNATAGLSGVPAWLYQLAQVVLSPSLASLACSLALVIACCLVFVPLYRFKVFIKI